MSRTQCLASNQGYKRTFNTRCRLTLPLIFLEDLLNGERHGASESTSAEVVRPTVPTRPSMIRASFDGGVCIPCYTLFLFSQLKYYCKENWELLQRGCAP